MQLAALEAQTRHTGGRKAGTNTERVKELKFDGSTSWATFHSHFEAMAYHNNWTYHKKATHLLAVLQGLAANILHSVPAEVTYEDIIGTL
jgi:hypothetical protein